MDSEQLQMNLIVIQMINPLQGLGEKTPYPNNFGKQYVDQIL